MKKTRSRADFPQEIERKFLLKGLPQNLTRYPHARIEQGYLATERDGTHVRLRKKGKACTLTFKRCYRQAREEREVRLSPKQFDALWPGTKGQRLTKTRYDVPWQKWTIEVDVYTGRHEGVVVAEVEFKSEKDSRAFFPPDWLGKDVTGNARYSNVRMALR